MLDIFMTILDVAKSLLGMSEQLRNADRKRSAEMSKLFERISDCLVAVSTEIRAGGIPHGRCAELQQYSTTLPTLLKRDLGESRAQEIGNTLLSAYNVESVAMDLQKMVNDQDKEPYLAQLEEASGKFRALANIVRVS